MSFKMLGIEKIHVNPSNPRGEYRPEEDSSFAGLVESIGVFGIIVPLIVKKIDENNYMIIDGDRRYNAAVKARIKEIPTYIINDNSLDDTENYLMTMYQIHMNRKDWEPATQQEYSELLQERIRERIQKQLSESHSNNVIGIEPRVQDEKYIESSIHTKNEMEEKLRNQIAYELSVITGMKIGRAKENILFSEWPKHIKDEVRQNQSYRKYYNYIITLEKSFIQPMVKSYPLFVEKEGLDNIRTSLYEKVKNNTFINASSLRGLNFLFERYKIEESQRIRLEELILKFIYVVDFDLKQLNSSYYNTFPEDINTSGISIEEYVLTINRLINQFKEYNLENFTEEDRKVIKAKLIDLKSTIDTILVS